MQPSVEKVQWSRAEFVILIGLVSGDVWAGTKMVSPGEDMERWKRSPSITSSSWLIHEIGEGVTEEPPLTRYEDRDMMLRCPRLRLFGVHPSCDTTSHNTSRRPPLARPTHPHLPVSLHHPCSKTMLLRWHCDGAADCTAIPWTTANSHDADRPFGRHQRIVRLLIIRDGWCTVYRSYAERLVLSHSSLGQSDQVDAPDEPVRPIALFFILLCLI